MCIRDRGHGVRLLAGGIAPTESPVSGFHIRGAQLPIQKTALRTREFGRRLCELHGPDTWPESTTIHHRVCR